MERGSLPVRLAMLGLASSARTRARCGGYPPASSSIQVEREAHARPRGRPRRTRSADGLPGVPRCGEPREDADAYFRIPGFITSLQDSTSTSAAHELSADMLTARTNKTTWVFDEYQHAVRLVNSGRLFIVPCSGTQGRPTRSRLEKVIDLTARRVTSENSTTS